MNYLILFIILIFSFFLAVVSLYKQKKKVKEVEFVNRELKRKRVIYHHSSSSEKSASR